MPISVAKGEFPNIGEIWEVSPSAVEVVTRNGRQVRITARRVVRGPAGTYYASYEERSDDGVWRRPLQAYPDQYGQTSEGCLLTALGSVNERG